MVGKSKSLMKKKINAMPGWLFYPWFWGLSLQAKVKGCVDL